MDTWLQYKWREPLDVRSRLRDRHRRAGLFLSYLSRRCDWSQGRILTRLLISYQKRGKNKKPLVVHAKVGGGDRSAGAVTGVGGHGSIRGRRRGRREGAPVLAAAINKFWLTTVGRRVLTSLPAWPLPALLLFYSVSILLFRECFFALEWQFVSFLPNYGSVNLSVFYPPDHLVEIGLVFVHSSPSRHTALLVV